MYVRLKKTTDGCYPPPVSSKISNSVFLDEEQLSIFIKYNGFVNISTSPKLEVTPDIEAYQKWKSSIVYTHEEANKMVVLRIREKYDIDKEFKLINLGISNPDNDDYKEYRAYVEECIKWGDSLTELKGGN